MYMVSMSKFFQWGGFDTLLKAHFGHHVMTMGGGMMGNIKGEKSFFS